MFDRWIEDSLLEVLASEGIGCIAFSSLCQGILTDKYLKNIPDDSRAGKLEGELDWGDRVSKDRIDKVVQLNQLAQTRGQTMAQMAIAWVLRHPQMTSALIGTSRVSQIESAVAALDNLDFSDSELEAIEKILV
jgi:L-glyceraldehyde 3-phosphate reductase